MKTHLAGRAWHEDGLPLAGLTKRFSCGPASVTFAAHIIARRGRQLEAMLGRPMGHPPPHARTAHHGATRPPCRRCPPPNELPYPPRRRKPTLLTRCPTLQRWGNHAAAPAAAVKTHLAGRALTRGLAATCRPNGKRISRTRSQARHANPRTTIQQPSTSVRGACSVSAACAG